MALSSLSRVGWMSLMLSLASKATAFHSSPREPFAMLHRSAARERSTEYYGRQNFPRKLSTSTRLQYREGNEDPASVKTSQITTKWWNGLFASRSDTVNEQDSVDEYLEFLDRRYNRLHEEKEEKPFSAINWLLQGSDSDGEILASHQQKEDALYVLGVAGLASQKLLQKHPQLMNEQQDSAPERTTPVSIEALDAIATSAENVTVGHMLIKRILVPLAKLMYFVHHRKQQFLTVQSKRAKVLAIKAVRSSIRTLFYGPIAAAKLVLEVGGGKANILSTITVASTVLLLARPIAQAIVTEGSVGP